MPAFDPYVALGGALTGLVVGMTGMGGGALMTPILVLLFGVNPLTAVSSDIVASMVMKPIGGAVHWRRGTVNMGMVRWLMLGSIPSAFLGVIALRRFQSGPAVQEAVKMALGAALLLVAIGLVAKPLLTSNKDRSEDLTPLAVKPLRTIFIGILGGLVVGLTSVGSGSLMIILLLMLYPRLKLSELVGTDLRMTVTPVKSTSATFTLARNAYATSAVTSTAMLALCAFASSTGTAVLLLGCGRDAREELTQPLD